MTFSERAKPLKNQGNITLREIAEACNISESMASRYINGSVIPPDDIAQKILVLLGAQMDDAGQEDMIGGDAKMQTAINLIREIYEGRISDLKTSLEKEIREKRFFAFFLAGVVAAIFLLLIIDLLNGGFGWFRY